MQAHAKIFYAVCRALWLAPSCAFGQANRIGRISPEIGAMLQLQRMDLCQNSIEELPPTIGLLTQ